MVCEGGHTLQSKATPLNNHGYIVGKLLVWLLFDCDYKDRSAQ